MSFIPKGVAYQYLSPFVLHAVRGGRCRDLSQTSHIVMNFNTFSPGLEYRYLYLPLSRLLCAGEDVCVESDLAYCDELQHVLSRPGVKRLQYLPLSRLLCSGGKLPCFQTSHFVMNFNSLSPGEFLQLPDEICSGKSFELFLLSL